MRNLITDVPGVRVGHADDARLGSGSTAIVFDAPAVAASKETVAKGAGLLAVYSAGLGIPFLVAAFAIEPFMAFLARFKRHLARVEHAMGALMVLTGIAFLTGSINQMSVWLLEAFPVLGKIG